ncbi:hypothetical protein [Pleionea sp. CnH1-48]|uniref:hypothetical protein n=1 Tax=Pleionea sp. CnH1-48 TaxID=2954494 RepID=UPI002096CC63|nr:hypothetical protein [Pleionea sp. CnH1-48]MCO7227611.1 hypothetical protein [Pleionea sp. CnH1-48]
MNKSDKKRLRRELEEKAAIEEALSRVRNIGEDIHIRGIGVLKIKLTVQPSFKLGESWDFRESDGKVSVYFTQIDSQKGQYLPGYKVVQNSQGIAAEIFSFLKNQQLPLLCSTDNIGYCDGTSYSVSIENGFGNMIHVSWGEHIPTEWKSLAKLIARCIASLRACSLQEFKM